MMADDMERALFLRRERHPFYPKDPPLLLRFLRFVSVFNTHLNGCTDLDAVPAIVRLLPTRNIDKLCETTGQIQLPSLVHDLPLLYERLENIVN